MKQFIFAILCSCFIAPTAFAAGDAPKPEKQIWSFKGAFGTFDRAALQRGFQVYKEVCAVCHSMNHLSYRNLADLGFNDAEIKAIAAEYTVVDGPNDEGEMFDRPGKPSDKFVNPYPNQKAARAANNGAYPADLSLMTKARLGGADYVYALLTGYKEPPEGFDLQGGMAYNEYFPGHQISMPVPLMEGQVEYADRTKATVEQMARDVTTFLAWAAEPEMEKRKQLGIAVLIYLGLFTLLMYFGMRRVWARLK